MKIGFKISTAEDGVPLASPTSGVSYTNKGSDLKDLIEVLQSLQDSFPDANVRDVDLLIKAGRINVVITGPKTI